MKDLFTSITRHKGLDLLEDEKRNHPLNLDNISPKKNFRSRMKKNLISQVQESRDTNTTSRQESGPTVPISIVSSPGGSDSGSTDHKKPPKFGLKDFMKLKKL
jgi:hypothetical protein